MSEKPIHIPVLLSETIESLDIKPDGIYVDCTTGFAGHSSEIAKRLTTGRLIGFDRDPDAVKAAEEKAEGLIRTRLSTENFRRLTKVLTKSESARLTGC